MIQTLEDITSFKWATVTAIGPLAIKLDGDTASLLLVPESLIDPTSLQVNDRVRVELTQRKCVIHAKAGGHLLASSAETITGTDPRKIVTPAGLAALTSTTSRRGLIELSTTAETILGTDANRAVSPDTLRSALTGMIPSSVTVGSGSASVDGDGWVTFTTVGTGGLMLDGCFDSAISLDYELAIEVTAMSGSNSILLLLRNSTPADITATNYHYTRLSGFNASPSSTTQVSGANWGASAKDGVIHSIRVHLRDLPSAAPKMGLEFAASGPNPATLAGSGVDIKQLLYGASTAAAGFKIAPSAGTMTGRARVRPLR